MCDIIHRIRPYNCCSIESWPGKVPLFENQDDVDGYCMSLSDTKTTTIHVSLSNMSSPKTSILVDFTLVGCFYSKISFVWPQKQCSLSFGWILISVYGPVTHFRFTLNIYATFVWTVRPCCCLFLHFTAISPWPIITLARSLFVVG